MFPIYFKSVHIASQPSIKKSENSQEKNLREGHPPSKIISEIRQAAAQLRSHSSKINLGSFIRRVFKGDSYMENSLKMIMTLETSTFGLGLNKYSCRIQDNANRKRYQIFTRSQNMVNHRIAYSIFCLSSISSLLYYLYFLPSKIVIVQTPLPYIASCFILPTVASFYEG